MPPMNIDESTGAAPALVDVASSAGAAVNEATDATEQSSDTAGSHHGSRPEASECLTSGERLLLGDLDRCGGQAVPDRDRVEPFLAALLQAEHLNLLVGAGLSTALAHSAQVAAQTAPAMTARLELPDEVLAEQLEAQAMESALSSGRGGPPNVEDRLRIAIAALEGLRHVGDRRADDLGAAVVAALTALRDSIATTESGLRGVVDKHVMSSPMTVRGLLITFLGAFAGRAPTRDRLHVFTTNYDRVIEWGADLAGLRVVDRFVGSLEPVFRSSRLEIDYHYSPPGAVRDPRHLDGVFRMTKLHGSLDWRWDPASRRVLRAPLPFGMATTVDPGELLIYPNAAKDMETTGYPYAELFRDFSAAACRPHTALITYGYSFGDDHINRIIKDMLSIPSTHLLIISYDDQNGRILRFAEEHRRLGQISLMIGRTFGGLPELVGNWLPWPSAEFLLQRRAQIYRDRGAASSSVNQNDASQ